MTRLRSAVRWLLFAGSRLHCPLCERSARWFISAGRRGDRGDAMCPWCNSLERHRFAWLYLARSTQLLAAPGRLLHLAPERSISQALRASWEVDPITADLNVDGVDVATDLTALCFADACFDWVYCSHVLEHVPDDRAAMAEIHRVLQPGGSAIIQVPIRSGPTLEDPTVTSEEDRLAVFGQEDHVRYYGPDISSRLEEAGFRVETVAVEDVASEAEIRRFSLIPGDVLFRCDSHD